jgi:hypothetical protein
MEERRSGHKVFTSKETCNEVQEMLLARTLKTLVEWVLSERLKGNKVSTQLAFC